MRYISAPLRVSRNIAFSEALPFLNLFPLMKRTDSITATRHTAAGTPLVAAVLRYSLYTLSKVPVFSDMPMPYVVSDRKGACNVAVYSPEAPEAFFDADVTQSQWIDPEDVLKRGGVIIWDEKTDRTPLNKFMATIPESRLGEVRKMQFPRAVPAWYQKLRGTPKLFNVSMRLILPETETSAPETQAD